MNFRTLTLKAEINETVCETLSSDISRLFAKLKNGRDCGEGD